MVSRQSSPTGAARSNILDWHGGAEPGRRVAFARQSLPLIVDHGRLSPDAEQQHQMGVHARERGPRLAHRTGDRSPREPHLCRRRFPDGDHARRDPQARRCRACDGARHQPRVADPDHLPPPAGTRPDKGRPELPAAGNALPRTRRPRLLRRLPAPPGLDRGTARTTAHISASSCRVSPSPADNCTRRRAMRLVPGREQQASTALANPNQPRAGRAVAPMFDGVGSPCRCSMRSSSGCAEVRLRSRRSLRADFQRRDSKAVETETSTNAQVEGASGEPYPGRDSEP